MKTKFVNHHMPNPGEVGIEKISITYVQPGDTNREDSGDSTLTIETECSADINDPYYLTLKTERWAIDTAQDIADVVNDFIKRVKGSKE